MRPPYPPPLASFASAQRGWRMALVSLSALCLACEAGAVFTDVDTLLQAQSQIRIRVGSNAAGTVDTVDFGTIAGNLVGNGTTQPTGSTDIEVNAWTLLPGSRTVTVSANSSAGMACATAASCGSTIIPFTQVSWIASNSVAPNGGTFDVQSGSFTGSGAQTIASFPSGRRMQNNLTFRYDNTTVYPAGTYSGVVTFTASMP